MIETKIKSVEYFSKYNLSFPILTSNEIFTLLLYCYYMGYKLKYNPTYSKDRKRRALVINETESGVHFVGYIQKVDNELFIVHKDKVNNNYVKEYLSHDDITRYIKCRYKNRNHELKELFINTITRVFKYYISNEEMQVSGLPISSLR